MLARRDDVIAEVLPEEKGKHIKELQDQTPDQTEAALRRGFGIVSRRGEESFRFGVSRGQIDPMDVIVD